MLQIRPSKELISTVSSKGQITVPVKIRRHLGINSTDKVAFVIKPDGSVQVTPARYPDIASIVGAAGSLSSTLSYKKMRQIANEDRFVEKYGK